MDPAVIAAEIVEELRTNLEQFEEILGGGELVAEAVSLLGLDWSFRLPWRFLRGGRAFALLGQDITNMRQPVRPSAIGLTLLQLGKRCRCLCFRGKRPLPDGPLNSVIVSAEDGRVAPARGMPVGGSRLFVAHGLPLQSS